MIPINFGCLHSTNCEYGVDISNTFSFRGGAGVVRLLTIAPVIVDTSMSYSKVISLGNRGYHRTQGYLKHAPSTKPTQGYWQIEYVKVDVPVGPGAPGLVETTRTGLRTVADTLVEDK
jgi:hypothetical protein